MLLVFLFVTFASFAAVQYGDDRPTEGASALVKRHLARLWGDVEGLPSQSIVYPRPKSAPCAAFPDEHFVHTSICAHWSFTDNPDRRVVDYNPFSAYIALCKPKKSFLLWDLEKHGPRPAIACITYKTASATDDIRIEGYRDYTNPSSFTVEVLHKQLRLLHFHQDLPHFARNFSDVMLEASHPHIIGEQQSLKYHLPFNTHCPKVKPYIEISCGSANTTTILLSISVFDGERHQQQALMFKLIAHSGIQPAKSYSTQTG